MTQASTNPAFKVGASAEQHEGRWLGTYTNGLGRTAVVAEGFLTREEALAVADRFLPKGDEDTDRYYDWTEDSKYPGSYAVYRKMRMGLVLVRESR